MSQKQPSTITILLVDDDPVALKIVEAFLQTFSGTVLSASLPSEALKTAQALPVDLDILITDIFMPEIDGFELAEQVIARHPNAKVLYITGDKIAGDELRHQSRSHLMKPFTLQELRAALNVLLWGRAAL